MEKKADSLAVAEVKLFLEQIKSVSPKGRKKSGYRFVSDALEVELNVRHFEGDRGRRRLWAWQGFQLASDPYYDIPPRRRRRISAQLRKEMIEREGDHMRRATEFLGAMEFDCRQDTGDRRVRIWPDWQITPEGERGFTVWFIGYPGSGKTTLAAGLYLFLSCVSNSPAVMIDSDLRRNREVIWAPSAMHMFSIGGAKSGKVDFSEKARMGRTSKIAREVGRFSQGGIVIGSQFCPLSAQRTLLAGACQGRFMLVHVNTPLQVCMERRVREQCYTDRKKDPGIDKFEPPRATDAVPPELAIDTSQEPLWKSMLRVMRVLQERRWMRKGKG